MLTRALVTTRLSRVTMKSATETIARVQALRLILISLLIDLSGIGEKERGRSSQSPSCRLDPAVIARQVERGRHVQEHSLREEVDHLFVGRAADPSAPRAASVNASRIRRTTWRCVARNSSCLFGNSA